MLTSLLTVTLAAVGQAAAPPEAAWLKSVPSDAEIVIRVRGVESVRDDLLAMVRAMSPTLADQVEPSLNQAVEQMSQALNEEATRTPFLGLFRARPPEGGQMPFAVIVQATDYKGVLSALNQGQAPELKEVDGLDTFQGPQGDAVYATQGEGFVAFGTDKALVGGVAEPGDDPLGETLPAGLTERLLDGDLGIYINAGVLTTRYADQIEQARQQIVAAMEQAGEQMGNEGMMKGVGEMYAGMFDAIKVADGFVLSVDFSADALDLSGEVTLKADSEAAKGLADLQPGTAEGLARMPADAAYYVYMNVDPGLYNRLQQMGMSMMFGGGEVPPEMQKAMELQKDIGRVETIAASSMSDGMRSLTVMTSDEPEKLVEMTVASQKAMGDMKAGDIAFVKSAEVVPEAETYKGYTFTRATVTFDLDAFAKMQPNNPAAAQMMQGMFGGEAMTTWTGTDGKTVLSVVAKDWDAAKGQIDAYLEGDGGIGASAGYRALREQLPERVTGMFVMSAQGLVQQLAAQFSAMFGQEMKPPGDMPKEPALMGVAVTSSETGYRFEMVVPSPVGAVIEKGLIPLFMGMQGQVNQ